jgi:cytochrome P450 PksS
MNLLKHPEQLRKLRDNPDLTGRAIEEMLRYDGPVDALTNRWACAEIEVSDGRVIEVGDVIIPLALAANRDPVVFENPDVFDITRDPNPHIAFGHGIHFCLGAPLARMEGSIAIPALIQRLPKMELTVDPATLQWGNSILLHSLSSLPLKYQ